jgi:hypothetical protein
MIRILNGIARDRGKAVPDSRPEDGVRASNFPMNPPAASRCSTAAGYRGRCADASARRAQWWTRDSNPVGLVEVRQPGRPLEPATGPAALSSRRIGAAASGRRGLGPLARPIPRLEPTVLSASPLASMPAAQPPPR